MVCDMAEQPARVADLVARWMRNRWCRRCIFNLKLPMKRRFEEVERCLARIRTTLDAAHTSCHMSCKQLYHDREEITGYLVRVEAPRRPRPPRGAGARRR